MLTRVIPLFSLRVIPGYTSSPLGLSRVNLSSLFPVIPRVNLSSLFPLFPGYTFLSPVVNPGYTSLSPVVNPGYTFFSPVVNPGLYSSLLCYSRVYTPLSSVIPGFNLSSSRC